MSDTLTSLYSEMNKAIYRESAVREASFLNVTYDICGIAVRQLTPYMYLLLDFTNSPFLKGGECEDSEMRNHIANLIWICSPAFKENDTTAKRQFIADNLATLDYVQAIKDISEFMADMFMDSPPYKEKAEANKTYKPVYYAWITGYIDALASQYGWDYEKILHMPMPLILQFNNAIFARKMSEAGKPAVLVNNLSDPVMKKIHDEHIRLKKEKV